MSGGNDPMGMLFRIRAALQRRRAAARRADAGPAYKKAQREYLQSKFGPLGSGPGTSDEETSFFFAPDELLVRDEYAEQVRDILSGLGKLADEDLARPDDGRAPRPLGRSVVAGLRLVRLRPRPSD